SARQAEKVNGPSVRCVAVKTLQPAYRAVILRLDRAFYSLPSASSERDGGSISEFLSHPTGARWAGCRCHSKSGLERAIVSLQACAQTGDRLAGQCRKGKAPGPGPGRLSAR